MSVRDDSLRLNEQIVRLASTGLTAREIAANIGTTHKIVRHRINRLRLAGKCPSVALCRSGAADADEWAARVREEKPPAHSTNPASPNAGRRWRLPVMRGTRRPIMLGTMGVLVRSLGKDVTHHIARTMPPGATLADCIAGIVKDAVLEEME